MSSDEGEILNLAFLLDAKILFIIINSYSCSECWKLSDEIDFSEQAPEFAPPPSHRVKLGRSGRHSNNDDVLMRIIIPSSIISKPLKTCRGKLARILNQKTFGTTNCQTDLSNTFLLHLGANS